MRFKETQQYLKPLYARLKNRSLDPTLLAGLVMIVEHCKDRNYLAAYEVHAVPCCACCACWAGHDCGVWLPATATCPAALWWRVAVWWPTTGGCIWYGACGQLCAVLLPPVI